MFLCVCEIIKSEIVHVYLRHNTHYFLHSFIFNCLSCAFRIISCKYNIDKYMCGMNSCIIETLGSNNLPLFDDYNYSFINCYKMKYCHFEILPLSICIPYFSPFVINKKEIMKTYSSHNFDIGKIYSSHHNLQKEREQDITKKRKT